MVDVDQERLIASFRWQSRPQTRGQRPAGVWHRVPELRRRHAVEKLLDTVPVQNLNVVQILVVISGACDEPESRARRGAVVAATMRDLPFASSALHLPTSPADSSRDLDIGRDSNTGQGTGERMTHSDTSVIVLPPLWKTTPEAVYQYGNRWWS